MTKLNVNILAVIVLVLSATASARRLGAKKQLLRGPGDPIDIQGRRLWYTGPLDENDSPQSDSLPAGSDRLIRSAGSGDIRPAGSEVYTGPFDENGSPLDTRDRRDSSGGEEMDDIATGSGDIAAGSRDDDVIAGLSGNEVMYGYGSTEGTEAYPGLSGNEVMYGYRSDNPPGSLAGGEEMNTEQQHHDDKELSCFCIDLKCSYRGRHKECVCREFDCDDNELPVRDRSVPDDILPSGENDSIGPSEHDIICVDRADCEKWQKEGESTVCGNPAGCD